MFTCENFARSLLCGNELDYEQFLRENVKNEVIKFNKT